MPTFEQAAFLPRAVGSLLDQWVDDWELVIVDDGSGDDTAAVVRPFRADPRIRYHRLAGNRGLGAAANAGLAVARADCVGYLPSDDLYGRDHLATLFDVLDDPAVVLAWSGVRYHDGWETLGAPEGHGLQLVQVMHRRTDDRWMQREELESDDLEALFWSRLRRRGEVRGTGRVTCGWTDHPAQRHKAIRERYDGGLNVFRRRYRVPGPLRFATTDSTCVDEVALYRRFRDRDYPAAVDGLKILLVGELSYNSERVLALAERGMRLYGLWTPDGLGADTVGPLPFGHVTDVPLSGWRDAVRTLRPDVIYAQLNWRAVPFARAVLEGSGDVPFVWHFKEAPQRSIVRGEWPLLVDLCTRADAVIFSSPEERDWFDLALPGRLDPARTLVIDGSLPKADWLAGERAVPLSAGDGEVHTAVLGRPLGFDTDLIVQLAAHGVHVHFHGLVDGPGPQRRWRSWLAEARRLAPRHVHVHPPVDQRDWVRVLSRYDAGWMHHLPSTNHGDLRRASWDDLNYPARVGTLLAAGLPLLQRRTQDCLVAMVEFVERHQVGFAYGDVSEVCAGLADRERCALLRDSVWARRCDFAFDRRVDELITVFRRLAGGIGASP